MRRWVAWLLRAVCLVSVASSAAELRDTFSDTWAATDALGRTLPGFEECGPPRPGRQVGIFYFLWLGEHANGQGPFDNSRILAANPGALQTKDSPPWGPMAAFHHWGEPLFGYYEADDAYVLRKHAQMLADAGVDAVLFDVTNQITYQRQYLALLETFRQVRQAGGRTPQVAFLCPFGDPSKVVRELYRDLYGPGLYAELWYSWEGKPLILADPSKLPVGTGNLSLDVAIRLEAGKTLGQSFLVTRPAEAVGALAPTWETTDAAVTLTLFRDGPDGERLATKRFQAIRDNSWLDLEFAPALPAGKYYLEMAGASGTVGWWSDSRGPLPDGEAFADDKPVPGDRTLRLLHPDDEGAAILRRFTFRIPQASYFQGPVVPDMWSWLEVAPQHVFRTSRGEKEQMSVGVAQNAVGHRLGSMSEPDAKGRSFHGGARDTRPGAVALGLNFAEQWDRALQEAPRFVFVTGWNEWIAMRFEEFAGVRQPVIFVDQFDQEHSRDIEPMKGGHGDSYYYQLVSCIRRYKGVRQAPVAGPARTIRLEGGFDQWDEVTPEYRDDAHDEARRDHPGYNHHTRYTNTTGRNDFVTLKVARDERNLYFHAETREPISPPTDSHWMTLYLDADGDPRTGWLGFDIVVNRLSRGATTGILEARVGEQWVERGEIPLRIEGNRMMLAVPREAVGLGGPTRPLRFHFKWADNLQRDDDPDEFLLNGDAAPNGRFCYTYSE
jgi:hypothetical protein